MALHIYKGLLTIPYCQKKGSKLVKNLLNNFLEFLRSFFKKIFRMLFSKNSFNSDHTLMDIAT